jgi:Flp pilus assembly protein TadG
MRPEEHQAAIIRRKWVAGGAIAFALRFARLKAAKTKRLGGRRAALVEFAFVAPVLLLIMVGTAQFGIALNQFVMLTNAVTTGAQLFSESPGMTTPYTNTVNAMIQAASPSLTLTAAAITTQVCTAVSASTCTTWSSCSTDATCATLLNTYAGNQAQPANRPHADPDGPLLL